MHFAFNGLVVSPTNRITFTVTTDAEGIAMLHDAIAHYTPARSELLDHRDEIYHALGEARELARPVLEAFTPGQVE